MLLDVDRPNSGPLLLCDLTQSWSPTAGGGIGTYLREKRDYILAHTPHHLLQIVPGAEDRITVDGRHIFAEVGSRDVHRGSPYRFILRTSVVRDILARYRPDLIESLCPWVLPWTAIRHRRRFPDTALVAGYRTDFPTAQVYRVGKDLFGPRVGGFLRWLSLGYAEITYREFDRVYTLSESARAMLRQQRITRTSVLPLGVDTDLFSPARRDPGFRAAAGLGGDGPLLIYAGRIDREKRADRLIEMMRLLPPDLGAAMILLGDGVQRPRLEAAAAGLPIAFLGYHADRQRLATALASSDVYVSAMADETFGISVIEAQASGLPVVGVAAGAMPDRVPPGTGLLGPVDDVAAMARNVATIWREGGGDWGAAARRYAVDTYSWRRTFQTLLADVYPLAIERARQRERVGPVRAEAALAG